MYIRMCVIRVPHCESNRLFPIRTWTDPMANRRLLTPRSAATCATRRARDLRSVPPSTRYRPPRRWPRQSWRRPNKSPRARALPRVSLALLVRALCTMESIHVYVIPRDRVRTCTCTPPSYRVLSKLFPSIWGVLVSGVWVEMKVNEGAPSFPKWGGLMGWD